MPFCRSTPAMLRCCFSKWPGSKCKHQRHAFPKRFANSFWKIFEILIILLSQIYANEEDAKVRNGKIVFNDSDVERVRRYFSSGCFIKLNFNIGYIIFRAHLNDLENIPPFLFISFLYILTSPEYGSAKMLFWGFTGARIVHTFVYAIKPLPQPSRALAFMAGLGITSYMAVKVLQHFW